MGVESEGGGGEGEENEEFCPSYPNTSMMGRTLAIPIKALACFVILWYIRLVELCDRVDYKA